MAHWLGAGAVEWMRATPQPPHHARARGPIHRRLGGEAAAPFEFDYPTASSGRPGAVWAATIAIEMMVGLDHVWERRERRLTSAAADAFGWVECAAPALGGESFRRTTQGN